MSSRRINRLKLIGIGALALAPVIGSYLLYWNWVPEEHVNYGTLIEARPMPLTEVPLVGGKPFSFEQLRGRWAFVMVDSGACPRSCEEKLWTMRQVRRAQGKEMERVERVWLVDDGTAPDTRHVQDYAGTSMVDARDRPVLDAFGGEGVRRKHIYLVDPIGNLMMRFPENADPKRMIRDLGRLLKYSRIG